MESSIFSFGTAGEMQGTRFGLEKGTLRAVMFDFGDGSFGYGEVWLQLYTTWQ